MQDDAGECSVVVSLDLSANFETVDHHYLIERLWQWVGISGSVWIGSPRTSQTGSSQLQFLIMRHQLNTCFVVYPKVLSWA